jgi:hypothetical protein
MFRALSSSLLFWPVASDCGGSCHFGASKFDYEEATKCASANTGGGAYTLHQKGEYITEMYAYNCDKHGGMCELHVGFSNGVSNKLGDGQGYYTHASFGPDDTLVGGLTLYVAGPFAGMKGRVHRAATGVTEDFVVGTTSSGCTSVINVDGKQLVGVYGGAGNRIDDLGLLLKPKPCLATDVSGFWKPKGTIVGTTTVKWERGTEYQHQESNTDDWKRSVTASVERSWSLKGKKGSEGGTRKISGEIAHETSSSFSDAWSTKMTESYEVTFDAEDEGKFAWQFAFTADDSCFHTEDSAAQALAITDGAFQPPCCVPGWNVDGKYNQICKTIDAMIPDGEESGCTVQQQTLV